MADTTQEPDLVQLCYEETDRRVESYIEDVRPGEEDSTVPPLGLRGLMPAIIFAAIMIVLWIVARFAIMPIYYD